MIQKEINDYLLEVQQVISKKKFNEELAVTEKANKTQIAELVNSVNEGQLRTKGLKEIAKIFETDFPNYINLKACSILQNYMNNFFESVAPGFTIKLDQSKKGIEFLYKASDEKEWKSVKMISGFEKDLLTLGFKTAVARAYGSDLLLLDEPDAAADEESSEQAFKNITGLTGFRQMFIISHKIGASQFLRDNGARVYEVKNGEFTLEG
jgi:DNA repair exonuclease SbcCD ATPase subunit